MFDLDTAIATWRHVLKNERALSVEDLDELEQHLRDQIPWMIGNGFTEEQAFRSAIREMGEIPSIQQAYREVFWKKTTFNRSISEELTIRTEMVWNYGKIALRNLLKHKGYSTINVLGLAVGMGVFLLVGLFVRYELSYDTFHSGAERTYRIIKEDPSNFYQGSNRFALTPVPLVGVIDAEIPGIERAAQISSVSGLLRAGDYSAIRDGLFATTSFFNVFSFPLLQGDPSTALLAPGSIVLTANEAATLFGSENALGKQLEFTLYGQTYPLLVTGIASNPPNNSHLSFNYIISIITDPSWVENQSEWDNNDWYTYFRAAPMADMDGIESQIAQIGRDNLAQLSWYKTNPEQITQYKIQPLISIHLHSNVNFEIGKNGDIRYIYIFGAIALFILLIACVNYMNLATARAMTRAREIGIRQVSGATRGQLAQQFLGEAFVVTLSAAFVALGLVYLFLPAFTSLVGRDIPFSMLFDAQQLVLLGIVIALVSAISGSYPAFVLSGMSPSKIVNGPTSKGSGRSQFRNVLVVAQYAIGIILIVGTMVINDQLYFLSSAQTGFSRDQIVAIATRDRDLRGSFQTVFSELEAIPGVANVSGSFSLPTEITPENGISEFDGNENGRSISAYNTSVAYGWTELLGLNMVEGRSFSPDNPGDEGRGLVINEAAKKAFGWDTAVGKQIRFGSRGSEIIGVVSDFNFHSFRRQIEPLILYLAPERPANILVKISGDNIPETLSQIEAKMAGFSPSYPFEFQFLDDAYNDLYATDQILGRIFQIFALLALFIACLGLFALSAFTFEGRKNEIGIRKALGANPGDILIQMTKDFMRLIVVALVVATPLAWFSMSYWLEDFAYRIEFGWPTIFFAGLLAVAIALFTVGFQSLKAARLNPVEALRRS